ncbi:MAG: DMT family transporter [Pseudomonadota bacterium]
MTRPISISFVLFGATLMSFVGLLLRLIESADAFQIMVYRSFSLAAIVLLVACLRRKSGPLSFLATIDRWSVLVGILLGFAFSFYVYALLNTSIASALFLLSSSPIFAAVLAWILIGEKPTNTTFLALFLAVIGVAIMVADGFETGGTLGNIFALISAFCFAAMLVLIRYLGRDDPLEGTFLGGVFASLMNAAVIVALGSSFAISDWDLGLSLFMGAFTIGLGITFVTWAAAYLPSSEVSILVLLESVLGPIWVWLFLGEVATFYVLLGGAIVLAAVVLQTVFGSRKKRVWFDRN